MSTKIFCDACGDEITPANAPTGGKVHTESRLGGEWLRNRGALGMIFEVITGARRDRGSAAPERVWNDAHWCKYCIIAAVDSLDDRPRAAPPEPAFAIPAAGATFRTCGKEYSVVDASVACAGAPDDPRSEIAVTVRARRIGR